MTDVIDVLLRIANALEEGNNLTRKAQQKNDEANERFIATQKQLVEVQSIAIKQNEEGLDLSKARIANEQKRKETFS